MLMAAPTPAPAADGPDFWAVTGVRADDALNLREAPDGDSRAIARIPPNTRGLKNLGCRSTVTFEQWMRMTQAQRDYAASRRWCRVEFKGQQGWVAGRFLREDAAPER